MSSSGAPPRHFPGRVYTSASSTPYSGGTILLLLGQLVAAGDRDAFRALYRVLAAPVHAEVVAIGFSTNDADVVVTSTFVEVWRLARFHTTGDADVAAWLTGIVRRRCHDRRNGRHASVDDRRQWWVTAAANFDLAAKVALVDLLDHDPTMEFAIEPVTAPVTSLEASIDMRTTTEPHRRRIDHE